MYLIRKISSTCSNTYLNIRFKMPILPINTDQPKKKNYFFTFAPRTKILKRVISRRKLFEISRNFAKAIFFREITRSFSAANFSAGSP